MDITIHSSFLPHDDPDASLAFYRDTLGFDVRMDVGYEGMRWIVVGPAGQPDTSIVLYPPALRRLRLRVPRSCGQPGPHPRAALSLPEEVLPHG